jgi:hypothetical protein
LTFAFLGITRKRNQGIKDERKFRPSHFCLFGLFSPLYLAGKMCEEKLIVKKHSSHVGLELLSLLRQQRYLYHQIRMLAERQRRFAGTNSPQLLLEVTSARRRIVQKLRELERKLRPIKANWRRLSPQIMPEHRVQAREMACEIREIIGQVTAAEPAASAQNPSLNDVCRFDELFVEPLAK